VDYPPDRLKVIMQAPHRLINPPLKTRHQWAELDKFKI